MKKLNGFLAKYIIVHKVKTMKKLMDILNGNKTYVIAAAAALIEFCKLSGLVEITPDVEKLIWSILAALGVGTLRHGIAKAEKKAGQKDAPANTGSLPHHHV